MRHKSSVQDSIPYCYCYKNGVIETKPGHFSRAYELKDINFAIAPYHEQKEMYKSFERLLNIFHAGTNFQIFIQNHKADKAETMSNIHYTPQTDGLNFLRKEMNELLVDKISTGKNSIKQVKYLVVSLKDENASQAKRTLEGYDSEINNSIKEISKDIETVPCTLEERLSSMFKVYNQQPDAVFGNNIDENGNIGISYEQIVRMGISTKDLVAPSGMNFESNMFKIGNTYGRSLFLESLPTFLSTKFITDLSNLNVEMIISIHYTPIDPHKARKMVKDQLKNIKGEIGAQQKHAVQEGYSMDIIPEELESSLEMTRDLMNDIVNRDQNLFHVTFVVTVFGDTARELDEGCRQVTNLGKKRICPIKTLLFQQEDGLNSSLPLAINDLSVSRMLTTESGAVFIPYTSQELFQNNGMYYGQNRITNNLIVYNRLTGNNFNGLFMGSPGSGKSYTAKMEMLQVLMRSEKNYVYIIDPQAEYGGEMCEKLDGEEIVLSPGSMTYLNPLDMDIESDVNPVANKCEYIIGMIEIILGGRHELTPQAQSIVSRCVSQIYAEYIRTLEDRRKMGENVSFDRTVMPTINNLYHVLLEQKEQEAKEIAGALEMYATGNFTTFAHRSNVDTTKRYVTYNIKNLGTGMKTLGLHVCLNDIWNKMIDNRKKGYWTWIYIDEFWYLLQTDSSCKYLSQIWKTARKWNGVPTGITQNVDDMLMYQTARTIFDNTSFIAMFDSSKNDRDLLSELLQIPDSQMQYITNSPAGAGLIYTGSTVLPFNNQYPKNTTMYKMASTSRTKDEGYYT